MAIRHANHYTNDDILKLMQLDNFSLSSSYCRVDHKCGGCMIYTKICNLFTITLIDCSQFAIEMNYECCAFKVDSNNFQYCIMM